MRNLLVCLPILLGGCDKIEAWMNDHYASTDRVSSLEGRVKTMERAVNTPPAMINQDEASFNECVLSHMKEATTEAAVFVMKDACLHSVSVGITDLSPLLQSTASYGPVWGYGIGGAVEMHFVVNIRNLSMYTLTQVTIAIYDKTANRSNNYTVDYFNAPMTQGMMPGSDNDRTNYEQLKPGETSFIVWANLTVQDPKNFFQKYDWSIIGAKGYIR
jgi:hypothetical protein